MSGRPNVTTFETVASLIAQEAGCPRESLTADARLLHDLGIYGDDVAEILVGLAKLRAIDWSGFPFDDYFYDEPHLFSWGGLVQHAIGMKASSKSPLTIAMLVAALERGRWSPSVPAGSKAGQQE